MIMQRLAYMFASLRWTLLVPQDGMCLFVVILKHKLFTGGSDFCWPRCIHDISDHFQHISMSKDYQFYDRVVFPTCEFSAVQTATHQCLASSASFTWQVMGRLRGSQQQILSIIRNHMDMEEWLGEPREVITEWFEDRSRLDSGELKKVVINWILYIMTSWFLPSIVSGSENLEANSGMGNATTCWRQPSMFSSWDEIFAISPGWLL